MGPTAVARAVVPMAALRPKRFCRLPSPPPPTLPSRERGKRRSAAKPSLRCAGHGVGRLGVCTGSRAEVGCWPGLGDGKDGRYEVGQARMTANGRDVGRRTDAASAKRCLSFAIVRERE